MSYSLNSLKGGYIGDYIRNYYRLYKGDARSLGQSSHYDCCDSHGLCLPYSAWSSTYGLGFGDVVK